MRFPHPAGALLLSVVATVGLSAQTLAQSLSERLDEVEQDVEVLGERLSHLSLTYVDSAQMTPAFQMERRLADGRLLYLLGDYVRASIVFLDIVESTENPNDMTGRNARYFLAESLFESRNLVAARGYFREVAEDRAHRHREDALGRLLEISFMTRDYTEIEALYGELRRSGLASARPDIGYILAKSLYFQGDYMEAAGDFQAIGADAEEYLQAQYFVGVCHVRLGDWEAAIRAFEEVADTGTDSDYPRAPELVDLALLALGRIYYELDMAEEALTSYLQVSRTSESYDLALYELCWTYIMMDRYHDALRTLEILMLAVPDSRFLPRAQLLRGDLLLRMSNYGAALAIFDSTVQRFGPLVEQLGTVVTEDTSPQSVFDALIDSSTASLMLPELAREWVEDDESMQRALTLISDLEIQAGEIRESRQIISSIEAVLDSASRVDVFPELRSGYGQALEIENTILLTRIRLIELGAEIQLPSATAAVRAQYATAQSIRERLELQFQGFPITYSEMTTQEELVESDIRDLEMETYRLGYDIDSLRAQLVAVRQQLLDDRASGARTESDTQQLQQELALLETELEELEAARDALGRELETERLQTGLATVTSGPEGVQGQLIAAIDAERAILQLMQTTTPADWVSTIGRIDDLQRRLDTIGGDIGRFYSEIEVLIDAQAAEIRQQVDLENAMLNEYDSLLLEYGRQGEHLAGEIAFENFIVVQDQFSELILTADVGIIDIAWRQKEDRTARIDILLDERNEQLSNFDAEFREVLDSD